MQHYAQMFSYKTSNEKSNGQPAKQGLPGKWPLTGMLCMYVSFSQHNKLEEAL